MQPRMRSLTCNSISARVLSYEDIVEVQKKRDEKEAGGEAVRGRRRSKRHESTLTQVFGKRSRSQELEEAGQSVGSVEILIILIAIMIKKFGIQGFSLRRDVV
jgi:hypothetical protein